MRVIICAAGDGTRWNNYLGRRKHEIEVGGETLLTRTVRMLHERGLTEVVITCRSEFVYQVPGAVSVVVPTVSDNNSSRLHTRPFWPDDGRVLVLFGDVFLTDAALDIMTRPHDGLVDFARTSASRATGKPGPEPFGFQFGPEDHVRLADALGRVQGGWWKVPADWPRIEIPDDGTDDFDFPDDFERFMQTFLFRGGRRCKQVDFEQPWFQARLRELARKNKLHRKPWEFAAIAQAIVDRGNWRGGKALGFAVGKEPLPAWLAAQGVAVTATDRPQAGVWLDRQHSAGLAELRQEGICDYRTFVESVTFRPVDMRTIPEDLKQGQFDITWSAGSFEHLGGVKPGLDFFCEQMKCLKQGGIAVHTTEYNINSNDATLDGKDLCLFRQRDLAELTHRLRAQGDRLWPIDLSGGTQPADLFVDKAPYQTEPHLNMELGGHAFTSVLLIAARGI